MTVNDREWRFLSEKTGLSLTFNDMYYRYLQSFGYRGALQDMIKKSGFGLTPSLFDKPPITQNAVTHNGVPVTHNGEIVTHA